MIKRDYKQISQYKIVDVYLKILSKHTRKKHYTIAHSSLSKETSVLIVGDLMKYLKLSESQSKWILNSHTLKTDDIKVQLLKQDNNVEDVEFYIYLSWAYRIRQHANLGYGIFSVLILIFSILAIATMLDFVKGDTKTVYYVTGTTIAVLLLGILYIYKRYAFAYKIKNDKNGAYINDIEIKVKEIKIMEELIYIRRPASASLKVYALKIYYLDNNKNRRLLLPIFDQVRFMGKTHKEFRNKCKETKKKLSNVDKLLVSYSTKSNVIYKCNINLDKMLTK